MVSASKISVPGGRVSGRLTSRRSGNCPPRCELQQRQNLLRIQSESFELSAPFRGSVAEPFDTDAARQTTCDRGFDEVRREERERDRHIDLTHAAFLPYGDLLDVSGRA